MKTQKIDTQFIRLDDFLKLTQMASSGGQAKYFIQNNKVSINNEICTMRGKKLYDGDTVQFENLNYLVKVE